MAAKFEKHRPSGSDVNWIGSRGAGVGSDSKMLSPTTAASSAAAGGKLSVSTMGTSITAAASAAPAAGGGRRVRHGKHGSRNGGSKLHTVIPRAAIQPLLVATAKNLAARAALQGEIDKAKSVYFDVKDSKDVAIPSGSGAAREMKLLDDELGMLRAAARSLFKQNQKFKLTVYYPWTLSVAVTTGLVTGTQTVDPSGQTEWVAAAALFDEYKVDSLDVKYRIKTGVNYASPVYPFYVICYDPADSAALTTVMIGASVQQHQVGLIPSTFEAVSSSGAFSTFHVKIPKGIQDTDSASLATGAWLPVSAPLPYGYLKFYSLGDLVVATTNGGFGAFVACNVEFRIRE